MAEQQDNIIQLGGTWFNTCKSEGKRKGEKYISSGKIKLSQEEIDQLIEWQQAGKAVKIQVWKNHGKEKSSHPDHNMIMILCDAERD